MALAVSLSSLVGKPAPSVGVPKKVEDPASLKGFTDKVTVPNETGVFESATTTDLSSASRSPEDRAFDRAARSLSTASSFNTVAQVATFDVKRLVDSAKKLAEQIETEVDPTKRDELAEDAAALVAEIDRIGAEAKVNGFSVVDAGTQSFQFSLEPGEETSDNTFLISIANVSISSSELGVESLDASSFKDDTANTIETLSRAQDQLQTTRASLESSERDIDSVARTFGFEQRTQDEEEARANEAVDFATRLASSLTDSVASKTNSLDPGRVQTLLASEEEESKTASGSKSSQKKKSDPTAPEDDEVNIFDTVE